VQNKLSGIFSSAHLVADRGGDVDTGVYILGAQLITIDVMPCFL
jgi:hypothetical protein